MLATNHAATGMVIGSLMPLHIAIPTAIVSHFVLDALPHYGIPNNRRDTSEIYRQIVHIDTVVALSLAAWGAITGHWAMFIVGWASYLPDGYWVYLYLKTKTMNLKPQNRFARFHKNIQRYERPWGLYIEIPLACILIFTAAQLA